MDSPSGNMPPLSFQRISIFFGFSGSEVLPPRIDSPPSPHDANKNSAMEIEKTDFIIISLKNYLPPNHV